MKDKILFVMLILPIFLCVYEEHFKVDIEDEPKPYTHAQVTMPEWVPNDGYVLTAYCACEICCGEFALNRPTGKNGEVIVRTSTGAIAQEGETIAVDPTVIPYGTQVMIDGNIYTAQDTGGAIKGKRIDVYHDSHEDALQFGKKEKEIFVLEGI